MKWQIKPRLFPLHFEKLLAKISPLFATVATTGTPSFASVSTVTTGTAASQHLDSWETCWKSIQSNRENLIFGTIASVIAAAVVWLYVKTSYRLKIFFLRRCPVLVKWRQKLLYRNVVCSFDIRKKQLVKSVSIDGVNETELIDEFDRTRCVLSKKDSLLNKDYTFQYERFFDVEASSYVKQQIANDLYKKYKDKRIDKLLIVTYRDSPNFLPGILQLHLRKRLEDTTGLTVSVLKISQGDLSDHYLELNLSSIRKDNGILIIQPFADKGDLLSKLIENLTALEARLEGVVTIFDGLSYERARISAPCKEDVLVELK